MTKTHPIAVVAGRTGLTQDVLRVWERRYGAVKPVRGAGGQRSYTDADIERLRLLHAATRAGRSIGQIAQLADDVLAQMVEEDEAEQPARGAPLTVERAHTDLVDTGLVLTRALESAQLEAHLRRAAALHGVLEFLEHVAAPLLRRVGDEWHAGRLSPAQEHMTAAVLNDIIIETMRSFTHPHGAPRLLVATPSGDRHAIGAAIVGASAAAMGWHVIFLGADLPADEIASAARMTNARVVAMSILFVEDRERVLTELRALREFLPRRVLLIAGGSGAGLLEPDLSESGVRVGTSVADLNDQLRRSDDDS